MKRPSADIWTQQLLYAAVQKIADSFPDSMRAQYVQAASDFRIPYWDWASRVATQTSSFPASISSPTTRVVDVDGATKQIANPLFSFRFDDKTIPRELALDQNWSQYRATVRSPDRKGNSQNSVVSQVLTNESASLRTNVSLILLSYKEFDAFSDSLWAQGEQPGDFGSLEDLHNEIHDKIGGNGGQMGSLATSAFDPVFWLHHASVLSDFFYSVTNRLQECRPSLGYLAGAQP